MSEIRVEIAGGIASGKTTLARRLAALGGAKLIEERYSENPFWAQYYSDPGAYEFEKNVSFVLSHGASIKAVRGMGSAICDFGFFQDLAYVGLSRQPADIPVIETVHHYLTRQIGAPSAIIHLVCDPAVLLERIRERGRPPEQSITVDFLQSLSAGIEERLAEALRDAPIPVLRVRSDLVDFAAEAVRAEEIYRDLGELVAGALPPI